MLKSSLHLSLCIRIVDNVFCRPYAIVEGDGFRELASKLISIGATYGKIGNVNEILPSATTVSRHLSSVVSTAKERLIKQLESVKQFGITTDAWTHQHTNDSYVTVTAQYVEDADGWYVRSQILATRIDNDRHTADNIRSLVQSILEEFGAVRTGNVYITDNASNMKAAFRDATWLGCACHNLNLVLSHGLSLNARKNDGEDCGVPREVIELVDACKEIVTLAKRSKINNQLETTLKQCIVTRWNSVLTTLKSVSVNLAQLQITSVTNNEDKTNRKLLRLLADIKESLLLEVIGVLEPFDTATKCLSSDSKPTLHLVAPTKLQLAKALTLAATDSAVVAQLKQHLRDQLERYFTIQPLHYTATLLDPALKNNDELLPLEARQQAVISLRQAVSAVTDVDQPQTTQDDTPPAKKARLEDGFFASLYDSPSSSTSNEVSICYQLLTI